MSSRSPNQQSHLQSSSSNNHNTTSTSGGGGVHMSITVPFATLHYDDSGSNVTYALLCHDLQNNIKWMIKRRYNDLKALHSHVGRHVPESADIFPGSGGFFRSRTNNLRSSIEKRRAEIDRYMTALVSSLLQMTSAKHQKLCQPLIAKLLQFVEYPEWEEDDENDDYAYNCHQQLLDPNDPFASNARSSQIAANGPLPFWKSADDETRSNASKASNASSLFAVSSVVEEAFNAQSRDIEITRSGSGLDGRPGGSGYASSEGTPSLRSLASSNAEETNPQLAELLANVTTYWAAPEEVRGQRLAVEIPDVACQPTIDDEYAVTVRHSVRHTVRGEVRRKYDEMLFVVSKIFATDNVPSPTQMREIILQFRRLNPKRQYNSNGSINISTSNKKDATATSTDGKNNNTSSTGSGSGNNNNNANKNTANGGLRIGDLANLDQQNNGDDDYYCYTTQQQQQHGFDSGFNNMIHSDSALMMSDDMMDTAAYSGSAGSGFGNNNNNGMNQSSHQQHQNQQPQIPSGGIAIPANLIRNNHNQQQAYELSDQGQGIVPFASPPARGPLADGSRGGGGTSNSNGGTNSSTTSTAVNQLPSQFGQNNSVGNNNNNINANSNSSRLSGLLQVRQPMNGGGGGMMMQHQFLNRVSNSHHYVMNDQGRAIPFRECKCSELAYCASGKTDHLQTPCGWTLIVEPTEVANQGTTTS